MDLDIYHEWAGAELLWFQKRLLSEGVEALRQSCARLGERGLRDTLRSQEAAIHDLLHTPRYLRAAAICRHRAGTERHAFLIASVYTVRLGYALLDRATHYGFSAQMNPSKAQMLLLSAAVTEDLLNAQPPLWPFEDGPDPFAGLHPAANDDRDD